MRGAPDAAWMPFIGEQHDVVTPPLRLFWLRATRSGLLVDGLHAYDERGASMRVRLLSLFPVVDARGPDFTRTETVTLLNDLCIMAPAALVDAAIRWRELDARHVEATFTTDRTRPRRKGRMLQGFMAGGQGPTVVRPAAGCVIGRLRRSASVRRRAANRRAPWHETIRDTVEPPFARARSPPPWPC